MLVAAAAAAVDVDAVVVDNLELDLDTEVMAVAGMESVRVRREVDTLRVVEELVVWTEDTAEVSSAGELSDVTLLALLTASGGVRPPVAEATGVEVVVVWASTTAALLRDDVDEASAAVTGQMVVSTVTTTVVSEPTSSVETEVA